MCGGVILSALVRVHYKFTSQIFLIADSIRRLPMSLLHYFCINKLAGGCSYMLACLCVCHRKGGGGVMQSQSDRAHAHTQEALKPHEESRILRSSLLRAVCTSLWHRDTEHDAVIHPVHFYLLLLFINHLCSSSHFHLKQHPTPSPQIDHYISHKHNATMSWISMSACTLFTVSIVLH